MSAFGGLNLTDVLKFTGVKTGPYRAQPNEYIPVDATLGSIAIQLPTNPPDGCRIGVKMILVGTGFAVTINTGTGNTFNRAGGGTTATLSVLAQATIMQFSAAGGIWYIVSDDLPLGQLGAALSSGTILLTTLPTSDPHIAGALWRSTNTLMVSTG